MYKIIVAGAVFFMFIGFWSGMEAGRVRARRDLELEAYKLGAAEYVVNDAGSIIFKWKAREGE